MNKGLRTVAAVTLFFFLTTQCVSAAPGVGIEMAGQRELPSYLSIDIPAELGTVDALYEAPAGANPQFILHIQNAHANYQAQMKIKQLLGYMNKKYGFKTIFVEGASEKLDPDYLRLFPDQERNLKLCDELAKQGELTGAELYMMEADKNIEALGIEEASLYKANYEALKIVFGAETDVTRFFKGFDGKLDKVASKTFTPETRELIADWKRFEQGRRDFMPFVKSLAVKSKKILNVDLESLFAQVGWPQISRLLVIQQLEKDMNKAKGQEEQAALINWLRGKGVSKELLATLENFNEGSIAVGKSATEVSPREVLERLAAEAGPKGFKFSAYPAFSLFAGYVTLRSELDPKVLFEEIEYLFTQMLDTLVKEPQQKALLALYRDGELLRKLLHLELNRTQWRQAVAAKDRIAVPSLVARLKDAVIASGDVAVQKDQEVMPKAFSGKMDELFTAGLEFYDFAHQREAVFYKEMQTAMTDRKITKAILITGGFHTDGMSDLFRENSISYGIVTPRLSEKSNENLYQKIMLQNENLPFSVSYLENALDAVPIGEWIRLGVLPSKRIARDLAVVMKVSGVKLGDAVGLFNASKRAVDAGIALSIDIKATRESKDGRPMYKIIPRVMGTKRGEITRIPLDQVRPSTPAVGAQESPVILDKTVSVITGPITADVVRQLGDGTAMGTDLLAPSAVQPAVTARAEAGRGLTLFPRVARDFPKLDGQGKARTETKVKAADLIARFQTLADQPGERTESGMRLPSQRPMWLAAVAYLKGLNDEEIDPKAEWKQLALKAAPVLGQNAELRPAPAEAVQASTVMLAFSQYLLSTGQFIDLINEQPARSEVRGLWGRITGAISALFLAATSTAQAGVNRGAEMFPGWPSLNDAFQPLLQNPLTWAFIVGAVFFIGANILTLIFRTVSQKLTFQVVATAVGAGIGYIALSVIRGVNSATEAISNFKISSISSAFTSDPFTVGLLVTALGIGAIWGGLEAWKYFAPFSYDDAVEALRNPGTWLKDTFGFGQRQVPAPVIRTRPAPTQRVGTSEFPTVGKQPREVMRNVTTTIDRQYPVRMVELRNTKGYVTEAFVSWEGSTWKIGVDAQGDYFQRWNTAEDKPAPGKKRWDIKRGFAENGPFSAKVVETKDGSQRADVLVLKLLNLDDEASLRYQEPTDEVSKKWLVHNPDQLTAIVSRSETRKILKTVATIAVIGALAVFLAFSARTALHQWDQSGYYPSIEEIAPIAGPPAGVLMDQNWNATVRAFYDEWCGKNNRAGSPADVKEFAQAFMSLLEAEAVASGLPDDGAYAAMRNLIMLSSLSEDLKTLSQKRAELLLQGKSVTALDQEISEELFDLETTSTARFSPTDARKNFNIAIQEARATFGSNPTARPAVLDSLNKAWDVYSRPGGRSEIRGVMRLVMIVTAALLMSTMPLWAGTNAVQSAVGSNVAEQAVTVAPKLVFDGSSKFYVLYAGPGKKVDDQVFVQAYEAFQKARAAETEKVLKEQGKNLVLLKYSLENFRKIFEKPYPFETYRVFYSGPAGNFKIEYIPKAGAFSITDLDTTGGIRIPEAEKIQALKEMGLPVPASGRSELRVWKIAAAVVALSLSSAFSALANDMTNFVVQLSLGRVTDSRGQPIEITGIYRGTNDALVGTAGADIQASTNLVPANPFNTITTTGANGSPITNLLAGAKYYKNIPFALTVFDPSITNAVFKAYRMRFNDLTPTNFPAQGKSVITKKASGRSELRVWKIAAAVVALSLSSAFSALANDMTNFVVQLSLGRVTDSRGQPIEITGIYRGTNDALVGTAGADIQASTNLVPANPFNTITTTGANGSPITNLLAGAKYYKNIPFALTVFDPSITNAVFKAYRMRFNDLTPTNFPAQGKSLTPQPQAMSTPMPVAEGVNISPIEMDNQALTNAINEAVARRQLPTNMTLTADGNSLRVNISVPQADFGNPVERRVNVGTVFSFAFGSMNGRLYLAHKNSETGLPMLARWDDSKIPEGLTEKETWELRQDMAITPEELRAEAPDVAEQFVANGLARSEVRGINEVELRNRLKAIRLDREAVEDVVKLVKARQDAVTIGETISGKYGLDAAQQLTLVRQIILSQARSETRAQQAPVRSRASFLTRVSSTIIAMVAVLFLMLPIAVQAQLPFGVQRFATNYTAQTLVSDAAARDRFVDQVMRAEGQFIQPGVGVDKETGMTVDGIGINYQTGQLEGIQRVWTAASKESLHVTILARAIAGDKKAQLMVSPDNPALAKDKALEILGKKLKSLKQFHNDYPGYAGFLPWVVIKNGRVQPAEYPSKAEWDWTERTPGLDNGQLVWAYYALIHSLKQQGQTDLAAGYQELFDLMVKNAAMVFYNGNGQIRAEAGIRKNTAQPSKGNYYDYPKEKRGETYYLDDPYEGELFRLFMVLFSPDLSATDKEQILKNSADKLQSVEFKTPQGPITVQRGHWFSGHEPWKYLAAPFMDIPTARTIFQNGERARTWNSGMNQIPGLLASVGLPVSEGQNVPYQDGLGIASISRQSIKRTDVVTPYASFPVILATEGISKFSIGGSAGVGLAWYHTMLMGPRMQGPYGSTESVNTDGTKIAPLMTWDSKILPPVAMMGGAMDLVRNRLIEDGLYPVFYGIVDGEYRAAFPDIKGTNIPPAMPTAAISTDVLGQFSPAAVPGSVNVLAKFSAGSQWEGGGDLRAQHSFKNPAELTLPKSAGFIFSGIDHVDLRQKPVVSLRIKTNRSGLVGLEIKNASDQLITDGKTFVKVPDTDGKWQVFSIDMTKQGLKNSNANTGLLVFSDPAVDMTVDKITMSERSEPGAVELGWNGSSFVSGAKAPTVQQQPQVAGAVVVADRDSKAAQALYKDARKGIPEMKVFITAYLAAGMRNGKRVPSYEVVNEDWLNGFAPWYSAPKEPSRPFADVLRELNENKLQELVEQGNLKSRSETRLTEQDRETIRMALEGVSRQAELDDQLRLIASVLLAEMPRLSDEKLVEALRALNTRLPAYDYARTSAGMRLPDPFSPIKTILLNYGANAGQPARAEVRVINKLVDVISVAAPVVIAFTSIVIAAVSGFFMGMTGSYVLAIFGLVTLMTYVSSASRLLAPVIRPIVEGVDRMFHPEIYRAREKAERDNAAFGPGSRSEVRKALAPITEIVPRDDGDNNKLPPTITFADQSSSTRLFFDDETDIPGQVRVEIDENGSRVGAVDLTVSAKGVITSISPFVPDAKISTRRDASNLQAVGKSVQQWLGTLANKRLSDDPKIAEFLSRSEVRTIFDLTRRDFDDFTKFEAKAWADKVGRVTFSHDTLESVLPLMDIKPTKTIDPASLYIVDQVGKMPEFKFDPAQVQQFLAQNRLIVRAPGARGFFEYLARRLQLSFENAVRKVRGQDAVIPVVVSVRPELLKALPEIAAQPVVEPVAQKPKVRPGAEEAFTEQARKDIIQNLEGYYGQGNVWVTVGKIKDGSPEEIILTVRVPEKGDIGPVAAENNLTMMGSRVIGPTYGYAIDFKYGTPVVRFDMPQNAYGFRDVSMRLVPRSEVRVTGVAAEVREAFKKSILSLNVNQPADDGPRKVLVLAALGLLDSPRTGDRKFPTIPSIIPKQLKSDKPANQMNALKAIPEGQNTLWDALFTAVSLDGGGQYWDLSSGKLMPRSEVRELKALESPQTVEIVMARLDFAMAEAKGKLDAFGGLFGEFKAAVTRKDVAGIIETNGLLEEKIIQTREVLNTNDQVQPLLLTLHRQLAMVQGLLGLAQRSESRNLKAATAPVKAESLAIVSIRLETALSLLKENRDFVWNENKNFDNEKYLGFEESIAEAKKTIEALSGTAADASVISREIARLIALTKAMEAIQLSINSEYYEQHEAVQNFMDPVMRAVKDLEAWEPKNRPEVRSTVAERQEIFAKWIEKNVPAEQVKTLEATTTVVLHAMGIDETKLNTPAAKVSVVLTWGIISLENLPQAMALLEQIAGLVDAGTYKGMIAQLAQAVPNAKIAVNAEECVVAEIVEGIGNPEDFVTALKFNFLLNPNARFLFLSLAGASEMALSKAVMEQVQAWGKEINNPGIVGRVVIQTPDKAENSFRKFQKVIAQAVAKSGKSGYVLAATEKVQAISGVDKSLIAGALIDEEFRVNEPDQRNAALNVLTKAAQRIRGVSAEMVAGELTKDNSGIVRNKKNGFSITEASLKGVFDNLKALFAAFKTIAKAA